jgi:geranylgeranyl pyrophosphate synthase
MAADYLLAKASMMALAKRNIDVALIMSEVIEKLSLGELWELKARGDTDLTEAQYFEIIYNKTAVLMEAVPWSAAVLKESPASLVTSLKNYGRLVGLAFQIIDDILDYSSDTAKLGKPVGQDLEEGRVTLPFILARASLKGADRAKLLELGAKPRLSQEDKATVQGLVEEAGALDIAQAKAAELADTAEGALASLPDSSEKSLLGRLARYTVRRDR